ncbi:MAG: M15 family metallopeptidase [Acidimicrobiales bacterium]
MPRPRAASTALIALALLALLAACRDDDEAAVAPSTTATTAASSSTMSTSAPATTDPAPTTTTTAPALARPDWLGTRPLPLRPDGFGEVQPTPPELVDRRLPTVDFLPPPPDDSFVSAVVEVPPDVVARSTWEPACPVTLEELRYVTAAFWGFDDRPHTGELLVNASAADDIVEVFRQLHDARFPIEEMRITRADELDLHPTGDGNDTGAFVCRPSRGSTSWSQHAYGLAVDVNPFHNPYTRDDLVLPELASAYVDRAHERPGMIRPGDVVVSVFASIGWEWGGDWSRPVDLMHFSANGR